MLTTMFVIRKTKGLTQLELAQRAGVYQSELSLNETGAVKLRPDVAQKLGAVLKLDPDVLQMEYTEYVRKEIADGRDVASVSIRDDGSEGDGT